MNQQIINNITSNLSNIKDRFPVQSIALFGSVLREDFNANSDIDILIDYQGEDITQFILLADELEKITQRKVDLVTKRSLKERHWNYLKDKLLYIG
jgi:predicted nucleotidyltransferase